MGASNSNKISINSKDIEYNTNPEEFEIIQQDNIEETVLLKLVINKELREIKLFPVSVNDKDKIDILTKNYISLQKKYIELKNGKKNAQNQNEIMDIEGEQENNSFYNSDNDDFYFNHNNHFNNIYNNNEFTNTNYSNPDDSHILLDISNSIWCMIKLNKITYIENETNIELNLGAIGFSGGKIILINLNTLKIHQELKAPYTVYSLAQFKDDQNYLISSTSNVIQYI